MFNRGGMSLYDEVERGGSGSGGSLGEVEGGGSGSGGSFGGWYCGRTEKIVSGLGPSLLSSCLACHSETGFASD